MTAEGKQVAAYAKFLESAVVLVACATIAIALVIVPSQWFSDDGDAFAAFRKARYSFPCSSYPQILQDSSVIRIRYVLECACKLPAVVVSGSPERDKHHASRGEKLRIQHARLNLLNFEPIGRRVVRSRAFG